MIYFFSSTRKNELEHPVTICAGNERRAFALAVMNFAKNSIKGSPKLLTI